MLELYYVNKGKYLQRLATFGRLFTIKYAPKRYCFAEDIMLCLAKKYFGVVSLFYLSEKRAVTIRQYYYC